jgi:beta-lactamase class D
MKLHNLGAAGLVALMATFGAAAALAEPVCTLLTDVATGKVLNQTGTCDRPNSPASTFKVPLSLMGYDSGLLVDAKTPTLPYKPAYNVQRAEWKVPTDPTYWLANSVGWYSQELTRRMGLETFTHYVQAFNYGNQDVTGDHGKNNGLTNAWLSSSLKISPAGQADFLRRMLMRQLPVSAKAIDLTEQITPATDLPNGWRVHGKTGTGNPEKPDGHIDTARQFGWFIGWADKGDRRVIFVHLIEDKRQSVGAGLLAKAEIISQLPGMLDKL